jgi:cupin 2 domain-containing protein
MNPRIVRGNLFACAAPAKGEQFEVLERFGSAEVERIVSSGEPATGVYEQAHDEWVALLRGTARLEVEGEIIELGAGDYLSLPAFTRHRVAETSPGAIWLAVHVGRS